MRIIAGSAGGIPLRLPKHDIRPTMEKIREPFDLIFADPPYSKTPSDPDPASELLSSSFAPAALANDGLLILERATGSAVVDPRIWSVIRAKRYGGTEVLILARARIADSK